MKNIFITIIFCLYLTSSAKAELVSIQVKGEAPVEDADLSLARSKAVSEAKRRAIELQLSSLLSDEIIEANANILEEKIYNQMGRIVVSYSLKGSGAVFENILTVSIDAVVNTGKLRLELEKAGILKQNVVSIEGREAIEVRFKGINEIVKLAKYELWLQAKLPGIKSLLPRSMKSGEAIYSATINGGLKDALSSLESRMPDGARVTLSVVDQDNVARLEIQVHDR